jgi:nitrous oxide reductase
MSPDLSRRTLLRTGAVAGVAGIAGGAIGTAALTSSSGAAPAADAAASGGGAIVLHVRDVRTGEVEIFTDSAVVRLRDSVLTSRISSALG